MVKVCIVVLDSIWYDPRVRKQIDSYLRNEVAVQCIGVRDARYDEAKIDEIPCPVHLISTKGINQKAKNLFAKAQREILKLHAMVKKLKSIAPEVIHANDLDVLLPCYIAAKQLRCKLIYDSHEIFLDNYRISSRKLVRDYYQSVERYIAKRVSYMVCVSNAAADYFEKKYNIERPIVITNCVNEPNGSKTNKSLRFEVLNHGTFAWGRGYDLLIQTAPMLCKETQIEIVIRGLGAIEGELRNMAQKMGTQNIRFAPPVAVSELIECACESSVGIAITEPICLNYELSVSNKLFEYAAAGLPVIMSDIPEHRYLNEKYHFGVIIHKNAPEELAEAILQLYYDTELYSELCINGKKMIRDLNWEGEFSKLISRL